MTPRNEIPQYEDTRKTFYIGNKKYRLTADGIATIRFYLMMIDDERQKWLESGRDTDEGNHIVLFNDIIEDMEALGLNNKNEYNYYYIITDNHESKHPICLKLGQHFIEIDET